MNEILDQLRTTFETAFGSTFKVYFKGRQALPAQSDMPVFIVYPISTAQAHSGTVRDAVQYDIGVEIIVNVKQYFDNTTGQGTQIDSLNALIDLVEERETDGDLKTGTVMGIINANLTIGSRVLYTDNMNVDYEDFIDAGEFPVAKAIVTFQAFDRPNRN